MRSARLTLDSASRAFIRRVLEYLTRCGRTLFIYTRDIRARIEIQDDVADMDTWCGHAGMGYETSPSILLLLLRLLLLSFSSSLLLRLLRLRGVVSCRRPRPSDMIFPV